MKEYAVREDVRQILSQCHVERGILFLPPVQLERELYGKVDKVLRALGAFWNSSAQGHVFDYDIAPQLAGVVQTGRYTDWRKESNFYPTPPELWKQADFLLHFDYEDKIEVLEPSAGRGAILDYLAENFPQADVTAVEINPMHIPHLAEKGCNALQKDFLQYSPGPVFDLVMMNPPFDDQVRHIMHAYQLLRDGGQVISMAAAGIVENTMGIYREWNDFVRNKYFTFMKLPAGGFKRSGTGVNGVILSLTKT